MSNINQKLSLLDALNNNLVGTFYIYNVAELIINDIYISTSLDMFLVFNTTETHMQLQIYKNDEKTFFIEVENDKINNLHIILNRGEQYDEWFK